MNKTILSLVPVAELRNDSTMFPVIEAQQASPYLNFNYIGIVAQKVFQGEVSFEPFEKTFYFPSLLADQCGIVHVKIENIAEENQHLVIFLVIIFTSA